jgi:Protein of unknown function (DUF3570)
MLRKGAVVAVIKAIRKKSTNPFSQWKKAGMMGLTNRPHPSPLPLGEGTAKMTPLSLHALTAAALILPGLLQSSAQAADDDEVDFQYSHYQEWQA